MLKRRKNYLNQIKFSFGSTKWKDLDKMATLFETHLCHVWFVNVIST